MAANLIGFRCQNFRAFEDTGWIDIRQLNFLVGRNSCGKSSLLRLFPLMRQSVETSTSSPFLWNGSLVDFGDFDSVRFKSSRTRSICLSYRFEVEKFRLPRSRDEIFLSDFLIDVTLRLVEQEDADRSGGTRLESISLSALGHSVDIGLAPGGRLDVLSLDGAAIELDKRSRLASGYFMPLWSRSEARTQHFPAYRGIARHAVQRGMGWSVWDSPSEASVLLRGLLSPLFHGRTSPEKIVDEYLRLSLGPAEDVVARFLDRQSAFFKEKNKHLRGDRDFQAALLRLSLFRHLPRLLQLIDESLAQFSLSTKYLGPLRAIASRYYRLQDLSVEEVDSQGENFAIWLNALGKSDLAEFNELLQSSIGITVEPRRSGAHISVEVSKRGDPRRNLVDTGFGYSQVLPVISVLWSSFSRSSPRVGALCIEQPELHLHPKLQAEIGSTLAVLLPIKDVDEVRKTIHFGPRPRFLIETHSEALLNGFGRQLREGHASTDDVQVLFVETDPRGYGSLVRAVRFDESGSLCDWPYGFFSS